MADKPQLMRLSPVCGIGFPQSELHATGYGVEEIAGGHEIRPFQALEWGLIRQFQLDAA